MNLFRYLDGRVECGRRGTVVARVRQPLGFAARARGLLGAPRLQADQGLWIDRCAAIHMFGMRHPIDVVFLRAGHVLRLCQEVPPYAARACRGADTAFELAPGQIARLGLAEGDHLVFWSN